MRFGVAKLRGLGRAFALVLLAGAVLPTAVLPATAFALLFFGRNDVDRNVPGLGIVLQSIEDAPAVDVRQAEVECDRIRAEFAG